MTTDIFVRRFLLLVALALFCGTARAQFIQTGDLLEDYGRLLQLSGYSSDVSFAVRPLTTDQLYGRMKPETSHPWQAVLSRYAPGNARWRVGIFDPQVHAFWNSDRPAGQNDGAVWQGRGGTFVLSGGAYAKLWWISAAVRPRLIYAQNVDFELWPGTTFREYPGRPNLDLPQRMGLERYTALDLGESYLRLDLAGMALGVSNQNMWWGPALQNAIIMSNNAPGFAHLFVGTSGPADLRILRLQFRWLWGRLDESAYYEDPRKRADRRFITGAVLDFQPKFPAGLSFGLTRMFVRNIYPDQRLMSRDYLVALQSPFKVFLQDTHDRWGFDEYDQLASVYARWLLPESGFEVYGEYARGDHSGDIRDFIVQLQHGGGYTAGLQKLFQPSSRFWLRMQLEVTRLEAPRSVLARSPNASFFYINTIVRQGYTQRGQLLGAGIGPGSNSQYLGIDHFGSRGTLGLFLQRTAFDNDRYHMQPGANNSRHEVEFTAGLRGQWLFRGLEFESLLAMSRLLNQFYILKNDETNLQASLSVRYSLMGLR